MWTPPRMCECGHRWHTQRCGPPPTGCPCHEYTEAEETTSPGENAPYYQRVDDGC